MLEQHGVPAEIAALPHVESSFNPAAYSKVGAAGLWQFMPSTAKRFMRVDGLVDERLDPYSATEAAANLMLYNYRLLGSWPLAVTAYNHGPGGLRRAQEQLGTSDIAVIVKRYQGATFGFASRNFYVAFLAALEVDRNAEKYFGPIDALPDTQNTPVELPDYIAVERPGQGVQRRHGSLEGLEPGVAPADLERSAVGAPRLCAAPPGRLPETEIAAAWARLPPTQRYVAQRNDGSHRVRRGETLAGIAAASGVGLARLLAANGWSGAHAVARGEVVRIPMPASRAEASGATARGSRRRRRECRAAPPASHGAARTPRIPPQRRGQRGARCSPRTSVSAPPKEPVSQRQTDSAALLPAGSADRQLRRDGLRRRGGRYRGRAGGGNPGAFRGLDAESMRRRCAR